MTYDVNVPNASQSPGVFPAQNNTNFTRLLTIINEDHKFNLSAASDDGYHKIIHYINQSGTFGDNTPTPIPGTGLGYTKTVSTSGTTVATGEHFCFHQGTSGVAANEVCLSIWPVRAAVNFDGTAAIGAITPRMAFNVTSVTKNAVGDYTITFANALPTNNYTLAIAASRSSGNVLISGQIKAGSFGTYNTTTSVRVNFFNSSNQASDGIIISITVMGG